MSKIAAKLKELNIELGQAAKPVASYVPFVISGNHIYLSGQLPFIDGKLDHAKGRLGENFNAEQGKEIARICGVNILTQLNAALDGNLDRIKRCVKLGVFVNSTADFTQHPAVANGVSDLMVEVFGKNGEHARAAVGVPSLPLGVAVEVDAVFEL